MPLRAAAYSEDLLDLNNPIRPSYDLSWISISFEQAVLNYFRATFNTKISKKRKSARVKISAVHFFSRRVAWL